MKFTLRKPCNNCPFRREGGVRLLPDRIEQIAGSMLSERGAAFTCHKTTVNSEEDEDGNYDRVDGPNAQHCAGGLIFQEKNETNTQLVRIMGRLGAYDPTKLEDLDAVFDTLEEMLEANEQPKRKRKR